MRLLFSLISILLLAGPLSAADGRITVTGSGEVQAAPDLAVVSVGVTTEAETASDALARNGEAMTAVLARLREQGIADRDLQTSNLSLSPRWEQYQPGNESPPKIVGFVASNQLDVRVRDLAALGAILDTVVRDGANMLGGLSFGISEDEALLDAARMEAVRDGRRKAELMAEAAGVVLGELLEINEAGGVDVPVPMARMEMAAADAVPVSAGEVGLSARITMVFAIGE